MAESKTHSFFDPEAAARLMSRPLVSRSPMAGTMSGRHKSPHRGSSVEFAEYRTYAPGDDIRRLDWRVYAKSDKFFIKEFEAETNLRCYFLLDCSGSMGFSGKGQRKLDFARRIISMLSYLVVQQGDAVGLVCASERTHLDIPPKRNPAHLRLRRARHRHDVGHPLCRILALGLERLLHHRHVWHDASALLDRRPAR